LPLSAVCQSAHEAIVSQEELVMAKMIMRNPLSEQRKRRLTRGLRRDRNIAIDPKENVLVKRKVYSLPNIDDKRYDKSMAHLMQEEDKNDKDFKPEKQKESTSEDSTRRRSDNVLPGPGFVRLRDRKNRVDEDDLQNTITRLFVVAEAMNVAEMAASRATAGSTFTEEAYQYFALPVHAEFSEAILTSFESNHSSI
jgi:hypothetical protein